MHKKNNGSNAGLLASLLTAAVLSGCGWQQYAPKPLDPDASVVGFQERDLQAAPLRDFLAERGLPVSTWPPARWDVESLELAALYFHPQLALARAELAVAEAAQITAAARQNPGLSVSLEHHSATDDGRTPWSIGPTVSVPFERGAKRAARIERAAAIAEAARLKVEEQELGVRRAVRKRFLDYHAVLSRIDTFKRKSVLFDEGIALLRRREELGLAGSFEVSAMRVEVQRARLARNAVEARAQTAAAALAVEVGVPLAALEGVTLDAATFQGVPPRPALSAQALRRQALTGRADIRRTLQEYAVAEAEVKEQIARQYPDFTLSPGYFFDQADNVWSLGAAFVLPLLDRNEGPIAEAQARREVAAQRFVSLQAAIIGEVETAQAGYLAALESASEARGIIDSVIERERRVERQFEVGDADRLTLVRAKLETADAVLIHDELATEAWHSLLRLEDAVQYGFAAGAQASPPSP